MGTSISKTPIKNTLEYEKKKIIEVNDILLLESIKNIEKKIKTQNMFLQFKHLENYLYKNNKKEEIYYNLDKIYKIIEILDNFNNNYDILNKKYRQLRFKDIYHLNTSEFSQLIYIMEICKFIYNIKFTLNNYINNSTSLNQDHIIKFNSLINIKNFKTLDTINFNKIQKMEYNNCYNAIDDCFIKKKINFLTFINKI